MSRVIHLDLDPQKVTEVCAAAKIGVSALERLPTGGVRLVCMSSAGAASIRRKLKAHLITGDVVRERHRPATPLW